jgi:hypothetical protein
VSRRRPDAVRIFIEEELVSYSGARLAQDEKSLLRVFEEGYKVPGAGDDGHAAGFGMLMPLGFALRNWSISGSLALSGLARIAVYELIHDLLATVVERRRTARKERLKKEEADRRADAASKAKEDAKNARAD